MSVGEQGKRDPGELEEPPTIEELSDYVLKLAEIGGKQADTTRAIIEMQRLHWELLMLLARMSGEAGSEVEEIRSKVEVLFAQAATAVAPELEELRRLPLNLAMERRVESEPGSPGRPFTLDFPITLAAVVTPEDDGGYSAEVPALPGCFTEAETIEELRDHLRDAAEGWLEARQDLARIRASAGTGAP